ncbi:MAG: glycoside hydrolase 5 family protein [Promethearchaeota archaeon]
MNIEMKDKPNKVKAGEIETREDGFFIKGKFFFPIGFNYWPRDVAIRIWKQFDPNAIERELKIIHENGFNCIRMFILWEDLNPRLNTLDDDFYTKFDIFVQLAKKYKVYLNPTLLIGHMSGQDWFPKYLLLPNSEQEIERINKIILEYKSRGMTDISDLTHIKEEHKKIIKEFGSKPISYQLIKLPPRKIKEGYIRDIYLDQTTLNNSIMQIRELLGRYKDEPIIFSWDLSNENQYWMKPKSPRIGREYMKLMYETMKKADPNHPITYGMGKLTEITNFNSYGQDSFADFNDYYSVHVYPGPFYYPMTLRFLDFYTLYKLGFEVNIARVSGKPVQFQEFGIPDMLIKLKILKGKRLLRGYYNVAVWSALMNFVRHGILSWCFVDFAKSQKKEEPYNHKKMELSFGNFDADYKIKESGRVMKRLAEFMNKIDFSKFKMKEPQVGIVMPENYNDYISNQKDRRPIESKNAADEKVNATINSGNSGPQISDSSLGPKSSDSDFADSDNPLKEIKSEKALIDNNINQTKALFSAYLYCKMNGITPEFIDLNALSKDSNLKNRIKLLILPNLKKLSQKSVNLLINFIKSGGAIYISTNDFIPYQLFKDLGINFELKEEIIAPKKKMILKKHPKKINLRLLPSKSIHSSTKTSLKGENNEIKLITLNPQINLEKDVLTTIANVELNTNSIFDEYRPIIKAELNRAQTIEIGWCFSHENQKDQKSSNNTPGKLFFLINSPEINHTFIRNAYRKENFEKFYNFLFESSKIDRDVIHDNKMIECGIFYSENQDANKTAKTPRILIALNHEFKINSVNIKLKEGFTEIKEIFNRNDFSTNTNTLKPVIKAEKHHDKVLRSEIKLKLAPLKERIFLIK